MLVFFDDILVFSRTWEEHLAHLDIVLGILGKESLYAKESKCDLGMIKLLYLGHIISTEGVRMDLDKVKAIVELPTLINMTQLRGFFGFMSILLQICQWVFSPSTTYKFE